MKWIQLLSKAMQVGMFIVGWFGRASQDRIVTLPEIIELALSVIEILDVDVEIVLPDEAVNLSGMFAAARHVRIER